MALASWIIILASIIIGIFLIVTKKNPYIGKMLIMIPISLITVALALVFIGYSSSLIQALAYIVLAVVIIIFFNALFEGTIKQKKVYITLCACVLVCTATIGISLAKASYEANIITVEESSDILWDYVPYAKDTKVAVLDEKSTLHITQDVPKMDGATALYPIYSAFAKATYPEDLISDDFVYGDYLTCNTTTGAYEFIVTGEADIIFVAGPSEEQKQFAAQNGVELVYTPIGKEAFVFFVNSQNPIDNLTLEQVQAIYSGEITEWEDIGVEDLGKIRAFQREEGSGSQSTLVKIMAGKELMEAPEENVVRGMGGIISKTADYKNYKNAIGYSFRFYSTEMVANDQIKLLSINGVAPTAENIENGTYPLASYFYAVTRSDASENTQKLVEWILSEQGQELIKKTGYTPIN